MIDFIFKFRKLCSSWQKDSSRSYGIKELSAKLDIELPYLYKYLEESEFLILNHDKKISFKDGKKILAVLMQKNSFAIKKKEQQLEKEARETQVFYDKALVKNHQLQLQNDWDGSFRNLCYFAGEHGKRLSKENFVNLCSNIIRSGIRSKGANLQEISLWLKKAVEKSLEDYSQESLEDALDLIETYSNYFMQERTGKGMKALIDILGLIETPACELQLWQAYKSCADNIFLNNHKDKATGTL